MNREIEFNSIQSKIIKMEVLYRECQLNKDIAIANRILLLLQVLNAMTEYENTPFYNHIILVLKDAAKLFVDFFEEGVKLYHKYKENGNMLEKQLCLNDIEKSVDDMMYAVNNCMLTSNHSDRNFIREHALNIKLADVPSKLLGFYNAYLYKVANLLNDKPDKERYGFFIYPSMGTTAELTLLLQSIPTQGSVAVIAIPQYQIYNFSIILPVICHELGHFIGNEMRERKKRTEIVFKMLAKELMLRIFFNVQFNNKFYEEEKEKEVDYFSKIFVEDAKERVKKEIRREKSFEYSKDEDAKHTIRFMQKFISRGFTESIFFMHDTILKEFPKKMIDFYDKKNSMSKDVYKEIESNIKKVEKNISDIMIQKKIEDICNVFFNYTSEIYADLCMIVLLNLSGNDYDDIWENHSPDKNIYEMMDCGGIKFRIDIINNIMRWKWKTEAVKDEAEQAAQEEISETAKNDRELSVDERGKNRILLSSEYIKQMLEEYGSYCIEKIENYNNSNKDKYESMPQQIFQSLKRGNEAKDLLSMLNAFETEINWFKDCRKNSTNSVDGADSANY